MDREEDARRTTREHGGAILVTWHGNSLIPIYLFRHRDYWTLVSLSRDGDFLAEYFRATGLRIVRGSTGRRGVTATREVLTLLENGGHIAITPDGPRGPAEVVQTGVVYLAQRSGKPLIPAGVSAFPRWNLKSWDRFQIPKPFARARLIYGDPIFIAPDENLEAASLRVSEAIRALQVQAEDLVLPERLKATERERTDPSGCLKQ